MKMHESLYSFKAMHIVFGMSWYSVVLKKRSRGGKRKSKSKEKVRTSRTEEAGKRQDGFQMALKPELLTCEQKSKGCRQELGKRAWATSEIK